MDSVGAFFIRSEDHGMLVRKLVNMPDGMFTIRRIYNNHIVETQLHCGLLWSYEHWLGDGRV
jgi:hypothetical protein